MTDQQRLHIRALILDFRRTRKGLPHCTIPNPQGPECDGRHRCDLNHRSYRVTRARNPAMKKFLCLLGFHERSRFAVHVVDRTYYSACLHCDIPMVRDSRRVWHVDRARLTGVSRLLRR